MELNKYPKELTKDRESLEASFVFCLFKNPELFGDYTKLNDGEDETLKTRDGSFYFSLGKQMYLQGYKSFDHVSIYTFLETKPNVKDKFDNLGGYRSVEELKNLVNIDNIEAYYDNIIKLNALMMLHDKGFNVIDNIDMFRNMTSQQVYDWYDYILNSVEIKNHNESQIESLEIDDKFISDCNAGEAMGISYGGKCPILNGMTLGVPLGDLFMFGGHSGVGKALAVTEPVLTPNGFVPMGEIKIGDLVIGEDGHSHSVTGVFPQGKRTAFKVTFKDGSEVICDGDHLWKFKLYSDIRRGREWKVKSLHEMMSDYQFKVNNGTYNLYVPVSKPVYDFKKKGDISIPPYSLGLLLGDGCITTHSIQFTSQEKDLVEKLNTEIYDYGYFEQYKDTIQYRFHARIPWHNKLIDDLRKLNLYGKNSHNKFIPKEYLFASYDERLSLLQGLLDTDGSVNKKGAISYTTTSKMLLEDVIFLIRSLGYRCTWHMRDRDDKGINYIIFIKGKTDELFSSNKHKKRYSDRIKLRRIHKYEYLPIIKIEKLQEKQEMQCIMVDSPDHTYLCKDFIVTHNSSFVFENMILPITESGTKCCVISNEQRSKDFKYLLLIHILTQELDYWDLTRKKIKQGKFSDEQLEMLNKAKQISKEKYGSIKFIKLFDSNMNRVKQVIKKLSKVGYQVFLYDTMKSDDEIDGVMWQQLLIQSRKLFQIASKENIAIICTYQLALHTLNKRFLDASCLSNAKQIKEVFSEMVYMREIWEDEYTDEKFDIKPYRIKKDENGEYSKVKKPITLDEGKKYMVVFLDKTRNDEDKQQLLYSFNGRYNIWKEIGFARAINLHE